ncbi:FCD domain-containing protein [Mesorhizobium sp. BR1-1-6]|nr:FCD domain-containing protein [Mesorhizobium sp. BR1-1-6]
MRRTPEVDDDHSSSAHEIYEARRLVELPTVRLAVERMDDAGIQRLRRLVEAQREMTYDPVKFQISDAEFHDAICRAGGNPLLADFLHKMYSFGLEFRRRGFWRRAPCH